MRTDKRSVNGFKGETGRKASEKTLWRRKDDGKRQRGKLDKGGIQSRSVDEAERSRKGRIRRRALTQGNDLPEPPSAGGGAIPEGRGRGEREIPHGNSAPRLRHVGYMLVRSRSKGQDSVPDRKEARKRELHRRARGLRRDSRRERGRGILREAQSSGNELIQVLNFISFLHTSLCSRRREYTGVPASGCFTQPRYGKPPGVRER